LGGFLLFTFYFVLLPFAFCLGCGYYTEMHKGGTEEREGFIGTRNTRIWRRFTEVFNFVVFNNFVENLRIITDIWPLRDHFDYAEDTKSVTEQRTKNP
jgi:hypothetical protein